MTKSAENIISLAKTLDRLKDNFKRLNRKTAKKIIESENIDIFILYYSFFSLFNKPEDVELETIDYLVGNSHNRDRIKAIHSAISSDVVWYNIPAFVSCVQSSNNDKIVPESLLPIPASEIIWGIVIILGISGSSNIPLSEDIIKFISASIEYYGSDKLPLMLCIKEIETKTNLDYSYDTQLKEMSIKHLQEVKDLKKFNNLRPNEINSLLENSEIATELMLKYNNLKNTWNRI